MNQDGGLRRIFRDCFKEAQWTSIESPMTASGIPDCEYCFPGGASGWIEFKKTETLKIHHLKPLQVSWLERRHRLGGRSFLAARYLKRDLDELYLVPGSLVREVLSTGLFEARLKNIDEIAMWSYGPPYWDWRAIKEIITGR